MILLAHMLFGAAIGSIIRSWPLAVILAYLGHYFLDLFPHTEYHIENIKNKQWSKSLPEFLNVTLDFCAGLLLILLFSKNQLILYVCALVAILPDLFTILSYFFSNKILEIHNNMHRKKIHFLENKKISISWRITSQITVLIISIVMFKL
mgnify:CR=1 FL=1